MMDEKLTYALNELALEVLKSGQDARRRQHNLTLSYKSDGSVVTDEDIRISERLSECIQALFPDANVISEEAIIKPFDKDAELTIVYDPIDGTESYSTGLPTWCIGAGIMNKQRKCIGSIIFIPYIGDGVIVKTCPGSDDIYIADEVLSLPHSHSERLKLVALGSNSYHYFSLNRLKSKFRAYGSALLHCLMPILHPGVDGAISPPCHIWDIAPAHAIVEKAGMGYQYIDGSPFFYDDDLIIERKDYKMPIVIGSREFRNAVISRLSSDQ